MSTLYAEVPSMTLNELHETMRDRISFLREDDERITRSAKALYELDQWCKSEYRQGRPISSEIWIDAIKQYANTVDIRQSILARTDVTEAVFRVLTRLVDTPLNQKIQNNPALSRFIKASQGDQKVPSGDRYVSSSLLYDGEVLVEAFSRDGVSQMLREELLHEICKDKEQVYALYQHKGTPVELREKLLPVVYEKKIEHLRLSHGKYSVDQDNPLLLRSLVMAFGSDFESRDRYHEDLSLLLRDSHVRGGNLLSVATMIIESYQHDDWGMAMIKVSEDPDINLHDWSQFIKICSNKRPTPEQCDAMLQSRLKMALAEPVDIERRKEFLTSPYVFRLYLNASKSTKSDVDSLVAWFKPSGATLDIEALRRGEGRLLSHLYPVDKTPLPEGKAEYLSRGSSESMMPGAQVLVLKHIIPPEVQNVLLGAAKSRGGGDYMLALLSSQRILSSEIKAALIETKSHWVASEFKRHHKIELPLINANFYDTREGQQMAAEVEAYASPYASQQGTLKQFQHLNQEQIGAIKNVLAELNPSLLLENFVQESEQQAVKTLLQQELKMMPAGLSLVQMTRKIVKSVLLELPESLSAHLSVADFSEAVQKQIGESEGYVHHPGNHNSIADGVTDAVCQLVRREKMSALSAVENIQPERTVKPDHAVVSRQYRA